jgi:hypothetical protein
MGVSIIRISGNVKFDVIFIALKALNYIIIDVPVCRAPCKYILVCENRIGVCFVCVCAHTPKIHAFAHEGKNIKSQKWINN